MLKFTEINQQSVDHLLISLEDDLRRIPASALNRLLPEGETVQALGAGNLFEYADIFYGNKSNVHRRGYGKIQELWIQLKGKVNDGDAAVDHRAIYELLRLRRLYMRYLQTHKRISAVTDSDAKQQYTQMRDHTAGEISKRIRLYNSLRAENPEELRDFPTLPTIAHQPTDMHEDGMHESDQSEIFDESDYDEDGDFEGSEGSYLDSEKADATAARQKAAAPVKAASIFEHADLSPQIVTDLIAKFDAELSQLDISQIKDVLVPEEDVSELRSYEINTLADLCIHFTNPELDKNSPSRKAVDSVIGQFRESITGHKWYPTDKTDKEEAIFLLALYRLQLVNVQSQLGQVQNNQDAGFQAIQAEDIAEIKKRLVELHLCYNDRITGRGQRLHEFPLLRPEVVFLKSPKVRRELAKDKTALTACYNSFKYDLESCAMLGRYGLMNRVIPDTSSVDETSLKHIKRLRAWNPFRRRTARKYILRNRYKLITFGQEVEPIKHAKGLNSWRPSTRRKAINYFLGCDAFSKKIDDAPQRTCNLDFLLRTKPGSIPWRTISIREKIEFLDLLPHDQRLLRAYQKPKGLVRRVISKGMALIGRPSNYQQISDALKKDIDAITQSDWTRVELSDKQLKNILSIGEPDLIAKVSTIATNNEALAKKVKDAIHKQLQIICEPISNELIGSKATVKDKAKLAKLLNLASQNGLRLDETRRMANIIGNLIGMKNAAINKVLAGSPAFVISALAKLDKSELASLRTISGLAKAGNKPNANSTLSSIANYIDCAAMFHVDNEHDASRLLANPDDTFAKLELLQDSGLQDNIPTHFAVKLAKSENSKLTSFAREYLSTKLAQHAKANCRILLNAVALQDVGKLKRILGNETVVNEIEQSNGKQQLVEVMLKALQLEKSASDVEDFIFAAPHLKDRLNLIEIAYNHYPYKNDEFAHLAKGLLFSRYTPEKIASLAEQDLIHKARVLADQRLYSFISQPSDMAEWTSLDSLSDTMSAASQDIFSSFVLQLLNENPELAERFLADNDNHHRLFGDQDTTSLQRLLQSDQFIAYLQRQAASDATKHKLLPLLSFAFSYQVKGKKLVIGFNGSEDSHIDADKGLCGLVRTTLAYARTDASTLHDRFIRNYPDAVKLFHEQQKRISQGLSDSDISDSDDEALQDMEGQVLKTHDGDSLKLPYTGVSEIFEKPNTTDDHVRLRSSMSLHT